MSAIPGLHNSFQKASQLTVGTERSWAWAPLKEFKFLLEDKNS